MCDTNRPATHAAPPFLSLSPLRPPWSLSVCLVVLPTLEQLLVSLREPQYVQMRTRGVLMYLLPIIATLVLCVMQYSGLSNTSQT